MAEESTLKTALAYLAQGWSVIPCKPKEKVALVKWQDFQKRKPTRDEIRQWWKQWPDANVAVITGKISGLVVVDVDTYRGASEDGLPPTDARARTARGGLHLFYRYPPGTKNVANRVNAQPGIDVRGDGGYVVVAPSVVGDGRYVWEGGPALGLAPSWVIEGKPEAEEAVSAGKDWLSETFANGLVEGARNDTAARLAGYLYSKGIPKDVATSMVLAANARSTNPLPSTDIATTVRSAYQTAKTREGEPSELDLAPWSLVPLHEFARKHGGYIAEWLVPEWMPDKTIAFAVSPPGHFKTWLLFDLAVSLASGHDFMGEPVNRSGPVLLIQQEDFAGQTVERLQAVISAKLGHVEGSEEDGTLSISLPSLEELPIYLPDDTGSILRFDSDECMEKLEAYIQEIAPVMVMLDPLYSAVSQDNFMADSIKHLFKLKGLRNKYGCSFMLAHHTSKGAASGREGLWGSQFLNAFLETGWQIRSTTDKDPARDKIALTRHFKMGATPTLLQVDFDIDTTEDEFVYEVEARRIYGEGELEHVMAQDAKAGTVQDLYLVEGKTEDESLAITHNIKSEQKLSDKLTAK